MDVDSPAHKNQYCVYATNDQNLRDSVRGSPSPQLNSRFSAKLREARLQRQYMRSTSRSIDSRQAESNAKQPRESVWEESHVAVDPFDKQVTPKVEIKQVNRPTRGIDILRASLHANCDKLQMTNFVSDRTIKFSTAATGSVDRSSVKASKETQPTKIAHKSHMGQYYTDRAPHQIYELFGEATPGKKNQYIAYSDLNVHKEIESESQTPVSPRLSVARDLYLNKKCPSSIPNSEKNGEKTPQVLRSVLSQIMANLDEASENLAKVTAKIASPKLPRTFKNSLVALAHNNVNHIANQTSGFSTSNIAKPSKPYFLLKENGKGKSGVAGMRSTGDLKGSTDRFTETDRLKKTALVRSNQGISMNGQDQYKKMPAQSIINKVLNLNSRKEASSYTMLF